MQLWFLFRKIKYLNKINLATNLLLKYSKKGIRKKNKKTFASVYFCTHALVYLSLSYNLQILNTISTFWCPVNNIL